METSPTGQSEEETQERTEDQEDVVYAAIAKADRENMEKVRDSDSLYEERSQLWIRVYIMDGCRAADKAVIEFDKRFGQA